MPTDARTESDARVVARSTGLVAPRFSVISAVYNVARYLDDFVGSIVSQSGGTEAIELILVDDGSTDGSLSAALQWHERHPELVTVIAQTNSGQGPARNAGMRYARGEWLTFIDPDDWVDPDYFRTVETFVDRHPETVMVATNRIFYDESDDELSDRSPLRAFFEHGDRLVDLELSPDHFHGHVASAFVRRERVEASRLEFDARVRPNFEDGHFCARYVLEAEQPLLGFLASAQYFYRKRADQSSTLQQSGTNPARFVKVPEHGFLDVLRRAAERPGGVPPWLQSFILYELSWYFSAEENAAGKWSAAHGETGLQFIELLRQIAEYFDPLTIDSFRVRPWRPEWRDIMKHGLDGKAWHSPYVVMQTLDRARGEVRVAYRLTGSETPAERFVVDGRVVDPTDSGERVQIYFGQPLIRQRWFWLPVDGDLRVELGGSTVELRSSWEPVVATSRSATEISARFADHRVVAGTSLWRARLGKLRDVGLHSVKAWVKQSGVRWLARSWPVRRVFGGAWVVMDRIHDANDSGEELFRYLRAERRDVNAWFVLEEGTPDWVRMRGDKVDRMVPHGTIRWRLLMLNCANLISSHADVPVHRPPDILRLQPAQWAFTFLQHGVIKDDISDWLNPKRIDVFVTSTQAEYDSIVADDSPYVFSRREVQLTGLPRFDALERAARSAAGQDLVLIAPTWRNWLNEPLAVGSQRRRMVAGFAETEFVRQWKAVLSSERLADVVASHGLRVAFLPHPNLVPALDEFDVPAGVQVVEYADPGLHGYFARACVLVTDFSSMAFNAAYVRRPTVYFQFDRDVVLSGGHVGRAGYFDYVRDGFGPVVVDAGGVVDEVEKIVRADGAVGEPYASRIESTFPFRDGRCSERVTAAIEGLGPTR